ncbi:epididymal-specific lipocalin-6 [Phyllostomus discolor]|uniref:Epididymal-specific lipocalin-6 n=1 Tax=Phyllostomus discolor TaxID=89673 RepID=A0A7E6D9S0_9CHIR|nr:epididymal-specific lipocalin-6 [Phyllostomus discolor]
MRAVLVALLALALGPGARAALLGRLDPTQVPVTPGSPPPLGRPGPARRAQAAWVPGLPAGEGPPHVERAPLTGSRPAQLLGPWYVVAVASGERGFAVEKATKNIEGVVVTLTPKNHLKVQSSRHRLERCHLDAVELLRQNSAWVFQNPALGVLEYRVLDTNFRDFAIVFTQLEQRDEAFSTVELYSRTQRASPEAVSRFAKWSKGLGFLSQQRAQLQADSECGRALCAAPGTLSESGRPGGAFKESPPHLLCAQGPPGKPPPKYHALPTRRGGLGPWTPIHPSGQQGPVAKGHRAGQTPLQ